MGRGSSKRRAGRGDSSGSGGGNAAPEKDRGAGGPGGPGGAEDGAEGDDRESGRFTRLHLWQVQIVRDLLLVGLVILIVWVGHALRAVTVPLLMALLLAYLFEPVVSRISRSPRFSREGAVVLILSTLISVFVLAGGLLTPLVVSQTAQLITFAGSDRVEKAFDDLVAAAPSTPSELMDHVQSFFAGDGESADAGSDPAAEDAADADAAAAAGDAPGAAADSGPPPASEPEAAPEAEPADPSPATEEAESMLAALDTLLQERGLEGLTTQERTDLAGVMGVAPAEGDSVLEAFRRLLDERDAMAVAASAEGALAAAPRGDASPFNYVGILQSTMRRFTGFLGAVLQIGLVAFLIPFYFYFFSVSWPRIIEFGRSLVPDRHRDRSLDLIRRMDTVVAGFVRGRIVISVIMGVLFAVGWWICGVPYAIPVGLIVGIFSAVPYLGGVGIPIAIGLLLFEQLTQPGGRTMAWWAIVAGPLGVFAIVQLIEGYVLTPMIAGKATNLDPVSILVAVLAGGSVLGVYGMLLAIPAAACAKILLIEIVLPKIDAWKRGERADPLPLDR
jgi:predicted PurR-regulated permease PerM